MPGDEVAPVWRNRLCKYVAYPKALTHTPDIPPVVDPSFRYDPMTEVPKRATVRIDFKIKESSYKRLIMLILNVGRYLKEAFRFSFEIFKK